ncbi:MAG: PAS domain S-box protein [Planctomycetota bacterium]
MISRLPGAAWGLGAVSGALLALVWRFGRRAVAGGGKPEDGSGHAAARGAGARSRGHNFHNLISKHAEGMVIVDRRGIVRFVNPAAERLFGRPATKLLGEPFDLGIEEERSTEVQIARDDGATVVSDVRAVGVEWEGGEAHLVALRDITKRRRAQEALRQSEARFRAVSESANDPVITADSRGNIIFWNASAQRVFGYSEDEVRNRPLTVLMPERYREPHVEGLRRLASGGAPRAIGRTVALEGLRKDGTEFPLELSVARWEEGGETFYSGIVRDVTARKRLEDELRQSQKMESIGRLAGGVAHDLNNKLSVVIGLADLALKEVADGHPVRNDVEQIRIAGEQAASLTRQLLAFGRKQVLQPKILNLNDLVAKSVQMLERLIGEDIHLIFVRGSALGRVRVDPSQMEQVIMNLAVNARDAMPRGGTLTIETANIALDANYARSRPEVEPGDYVMLGVSDTGCGMAPETRARAFEPFFTTKEEGKGTGLGLSVIHGIVKQSGGHVRVYSEPEQGASFKIYLPSAEGAPAEEPAREVVSVEPGGTETVLLVEDERLVRDLVKRVLEQHGYTVLEAPNGERALRVLQRHAGEIQLLLTDVVMPEMGGEELVEWALHTRADLKVLFMSGYTERAVVFHGHLDPGKAFLQKPATPGAILRKVRQVLDAPPAEVSATSASLGGEHS